jgi:endoglucanase
MKKKMYLFLVIAVIFSTCNTTESSWRYMEHGHVDAVVLSPPFSRGVNFSAWFETFSAQSISFTKYTEEDFANVKSLGADVVRLPIRLHSMTNGSPDYIIDPLLFKFLDLAIDWAEKHELYIIIDNHSFDPVQPTDYNIDRILLPVWAQVAQRYKDRSDFVVYEILNEPHGISDARWGEIQGMAIETIRRYDQTRWIIVGGTDYNSIGKLFSIPEYDDPYLIYTFHFYDPYLFTHQGATWGGPPLLTNLTGLPFPAEGRRMPRLPSDLRGSWVESSLIYSYVNDSRPSTLYRTLDRAVAFSRERNVPIFCGEFGVLMWNSPNEDRVRWYEIVTAAMNRRNIAWTSWDYFGGFGIFNFDGRGDFHSDLNVEVVRAMGFTPPPQVPRSEEPIRDGFIIYDDFPNRVLSVGFWGENADFSLYETRTNTGEFAIRWGNASQYNIFWFGFDRNGNLSDLVQAHSLEFYARTETPVIFDVRFMNSGISNSIPWRMRYTINEDILPPDGRWHRIRIPLADMSEHGAWINVTREWLTPRNQFSWNDVSQLEFVAEHMDMYGFAVWFDDIKITR